MGVSMKKILSVALLASTLIAAPAMAGAIITNGTIGLGVDNAGQLNINSTIRSAGIGGGTSGTFSYGLRDIATNFEATAQGCLCEGWGAAVAGTGTTVYANNASGTSATLVSFASTASTATSIVKSVGAGALTVTHVYAPSASSLLYQVEVTITNTSGADFAGATLYRRVMDWDIEPTFFNEYSTIKGGAGAANVLFTSNNGFANSNPFVAGGSIAGVTGDFTDVGPRDQGALFDFTFGALKAGESQKLTVFYGAAPTEASGLAALGLVGAEVYSFGQAADDINGGAAGRRTFIFGFKGVGGTVIPGGVPESSTWMMMIAGFGIAGMSLRSRRRKSAVSMA
jgi:hypothetical protein